MLYFLQFSIAGVPNIFANTYSVKFDKLIQTNTYF